MGVKLKAIVDMAEELGVDITYLARVVRESNLEPAVCKRKEDGHQVKALTMSQWAKLMKEVPTLQAQPLGKTEVPLIQAATELKMDKSNLRKMLERLKIKTVPRRLHSGRPTPCLSLADYTKLKKQRGGLPVI